MTRGMSDETLDGIAYGLKLAGIPGLKERRLDYERRINECRKQAASMTREQIVARLREDMPAYIGELLMKEDLGRLHDRYAHTFYERVPKPTK